MKDRKRFFVSGCPKSKGSHSWGKQGQVYDTCKGLKKWEDTIAWMARRVAEKTPPACPIDLKLNFILEGETPGVCIEIREIGVSELEYHTKKPDIDKLTRAVMDGLTKGGIYKDDSQVVRIEAQKLRGNKYV